MNQTYYTILTKRGAALLANATALGVPLKITQMAVGDGDGIIPKPDANQTNLVHEVRRAAINTLFIDKENPNQIIAEQVIPESDGGWFIHEIGLFDDKGNLIAVGNCPTTYKPKLAEGSGRTQVIRMIIIVDNTQSIELKIDPAVVLATRQYVDELITAKMAIHEKSTNHPGATTKSKGFVQLNSAIDSNLENQAATPLAVKKVNDNVVSAHNRISQVHDYSKEIDNKVTLANNRITDVHEYAKSINNDVVSAHNRISQVHDYSKEIDNKVTLANNRITDVHEYAKSINNDVVSAHNRISQVHDYSKEIDERVTVANNRITDVHQFAIGVNNNVNYVNDRVNVITDKFQTDNYESRIYSHDKRVYIVIRDDGVMGMYSHVKNDFVWYVNHDGWMSGYITADRIGGLDQFVRDRTPPVGVPMPWPQHYPPTGYFECNGSTFDKNQCPKLAAAYPAGVLPDLRGEFIRGWDNARGADPYRSILEWQAPQISAHRHVEGWGENQNTFSEKWRENFAPFGATGGSGHWVGASSNDMDNALLYTNDGTTGSITTSAGTTSWYDLNPAGLVGHETRPRNIAFMYIVKAE